MAITVVSPVRISATMDFLKKALGCSDAEVGIAVSKLPQILGYSEVKLSRSLEFLKAEVGLQPQYFVHRPALLSYSFRKRLMPLHEERFQII
ncbi:hypothetical protein E2562_013784 [Oryza meyeriana var. granulata]|uniref:Uncharacterized protein n=1 Tax=Oryza meyeriana var. granulata TaxID=110450 RepID=A0A6G1F869_9ORYZ|nr:hypothetical protein E2562_013784 [Oryza meyeriana var. granulata]